MGGQLQQPTMSLEDASRGAGLVFDPMTNMYYQPSTGQFYKTGTFKNQNPLESLSGFNQFIQLSQFGNRALAGAPSNALNFGGYVFNPFTGSMDGITNGVFSPIGRIKPEVREIASPVGILNSLFGDIDFSGVSQSGQSSGAGRFLGNPNE